VHCLLCGCCSSERKRARRTWRLNDIAFVRENRHGFLQAGENLWINTNRSACGGGGYGMHSYHWAKIDADAVHRAAVGAGPSTQQMI
jgi:hypothetical protein